MCFISEPDWYASIANLGVEPVGAPTRCAECGEVIPVGGIVHTIELIEWEECRRCEDGECDCGDGECCRCAEPDFGETFRTRHCDSCHKFLEAIRAAEIDAGCPFDESQPNLGEMRQAIRDAGRDESERYFTRAAALFPELVASGYLGRLWRSIFGSTY